MNPVVKWMVPATTSFGFLIGISAWSASAAEKAPGEKPIATKAEAKGTVTGKLVDKDGNAVAGARVTLGKPMVGARHQQQQKPQGQAAEQKLTATADKKPAVSGEPKREPVATTTTDREGKFTFKDVPAGDYVVRTHLRGQGMAVARVTVAAGKAADVALTLKPAPGGGGGAAARNKPKPPVKPEKQAQREDRKAEKTGLDR